MFWALEWTVSHSDKPEELIFHRKSVTLRCLQPLTKIFYFSFFNIISNSIFKNLKSEIFLYQKLGQLCEIFMQPCRISDIILILEVNSDKLSIFQNPN